MQTQLLLLTSMDNFEEELPKPTVGKLSADSGPSANRQINSTVQTANRQATDRSIQPYKQLTDRSIKIVKVHERKQHSSVLLDQNKL